MSSDGLDNSRRRFLTAATVVVGAVGTVVAAVPFVASWSPSARAKSAGAPVEANIGKLEPGQQIIFKWQGKPVWVVRRDQKALATLEDSSLIENLRDVESDDSIQPEYTKNVYRSIKPEYLNSFQSIIRKSQILKMYFESYKLTGETPAPHATRRVDGL